ncbi:MAG: hypothetical protein R2694_02310 [Ilumatobacteraceae bacterium]|nr:hypothetical protein [Ilumatobacter sp.]MCB9379368.1 hypothetical protein [Acidimicrobiaceae bacterium]MCO5330054.1 hypothetical protein [Ilumatobacteraceae bacterium]
MLHLTARAVTAWGFAFRFQSDHHALVDLVEYCYRDLPDAPGPAAAITVRKTGRGGHGLAMTVQHPDGTIEPCGEGRTLEEMPELLWWEVNRRARASAADRVVLHAATIADDRGAWLLCAGSQVGKSTLAAANALRHGRHLSDDMALLADDTATVLPYARPLMLRPGGREVLVAAGRPDGAVVLPPGDAPRLAVHGDEWFLPASALGATVPAGPVPIRAIGFLERGPGAAVEPLGQASTLQRLVSHCATLDRHGAADFRRLERLARQSPGYQVVLGAPGEVLDLLAVVPAAPPSPASP